jgi:hypothetical protein
MTKKDILKRLIKVQKLLWKDDDLMNQETLFDLQAEMQVLVLTLANDTNSTDVILKEFPWLYRQS